MNVEVLVQFYPWFKFYFPLFQTHYHTLPTAKQRKIKFNQRNLYQIEPQHRHRAKVLMLYKT